MARGDVEAILNLYDPEVAFVSAGGDIKSGLAELRKELALMASRKPRFDFEVKQMRSGRMKCSSCCPTRKSVSSPVNPGRS